MSVALDPMDHGFRVEQAGRLRVLGLMRRFRPDTRLGACTVQHGRCHKLADLCTAPPLRTAMLKIASPTSLKALDPDDA